MSEGEDSDLSADGVDAVRLVQRSRWCNNSGINRLDGPKVSLTPSSS